MKQQIIDDKKHPKREIVKLIIEKKYYGGFANVSWDEHGYECNVNWIIFDDQIIMASPGYEEATLIIQPVDDFIEENEEYIEENEEYIEENEEL
jgi:hypothetical protein